MSNLFRMLRHVFFLLTISTVFYVLVSCQSSRRDGVPVIGFVEAFEDATIAQARQGFVDALRDSGYSEESGTVHVIYRNAQGDASTLNQIVSYFNSERVELIGTSTTLATMATIQRTMAIPVFMSVTAMPQILGLTDTSGEPPANLFGTGENLAYIDTSFAIMTDMIRPRGEQLTVGMIYNQSEPQSVDAYKRLNDLSAKLGVRLVAQPLNSSSDAQLVVRSLLTDDIDVFFANPDNTVFAAFEVILKNCDDRGVPIFTSESGLVARGAVAAFGADVYQWGYQTGAQAAAYLKIGLTDDLGVEMVRIRKRVFNPQAAEKFDISVPEGFEKVVK